MNALAPLALALALAQAPAAPPSPAPAPVSPGAPAEALAGPSLTLDDALQAAAGRNWDWRVLEARLEQANELSWKAWSAYLPQVTLSGSYTRNEEEATLSLPAGYYVRDLGSPQGPAANDPGQPISPANPPGTATPYTIYPSALQTFTLQPLESIAGRAEVTQLLVAPQLWFGIQAAHRAERAAEQSIENGRREVLFGVARAYYGVASLRQATAVSERLLEIAQRQEKDARVRYQAGAVAKVALLRAEIDRARAEQDLKRSRNAYASAKIALATLLARDTDFEVVDPPEPTLPADTAGLEEQALRDRADVQAARLQVDAARASRNSTLGRYLPNIGAFANYTVLNNAGLTGQDRFWAIGLQAQWKILDGGLRESDLREGNAKITEAEAVRSGVEAAARAQVRQALLDLDSARANAAKAKEQRDLAAENQRLVDVAYRAGTATAVEQADATAVLRNAEIAFTAESLSAQLAAVQLLKAAGAFHPTRR